MSPIRIICAALAVIVTTADAQAPARTAADSALLRALRLPEVMQLARASGVADSTIRDILGTLRRGGVLAGDAVPVLDAEIAADSGRRRMDNFGSFVRAQVEAGVRGQELAAAIRAEHARRGVGRPDGVGRRPGRQTPNTPRRP